MIFRYLLALAAALTLSTASIATPYSTSPVAPSDADRWRIGYVQSGDYAEYPLTLGEIIDGLEVLGWLQLPTPRPDDLSGPELWQWLAQNVRSEWLEFADDAYWQPGNFDADQRAPMRKAIADRLHGKQDIDLIIAMGTWAGQDMREIGPPVPTVVGSVSDALASGIADSALDSGRDNLHVRIEPERYQRQLRLFHEIVGFDTLGLVYEDSESGRAYSAVGAAEQVALELGFQLEHCHAPSSSIPQDVAIQNAVDCFSELANRHVGAVYVTSHQGVTPESVKQIATTMLQARVPSFSMAGSREVESGLLMSIAQADLSHVGLFHAETIARVFNGARPREISQLWVDPPKIALNLSTARRIGFDPPVDILLAADEVYE
ncbi:MAG: ABC transporter substrate binding protein [Burkholderiaceae bacterium]